MSELPFSPFSFVIAMFFCRKIILSGNSCLGIEMTSQSNAKRDTRYVSHGSRELKLILLLDNPICGSLCPNAF